MRTLVLNASYEPLNVVSWKRAVNLVLKGEAEVVHEYETPVSSASALHAMPSVIRLLKFRTIPFRKRPPAVNRRSVLARDKGECQFTHCSRPATTVDHVHPRSKGGTNTWDNVAAACKPCNFKKADKSLKDMGWKLKRTPKAPHGRYMLIGLQPRPEWEQYLQSA